MDYVSDTHWLCETLHVCDIGTRVSLTFHMGKQAKACAEVQITEAEPGRSSGSQSLAWLLNNRCTLAQFGEKGHHRLKDDKSPAGT